MVADDAALFREGLSRVLAEAGFEVTLDPYVAELGAATLERYGASPMPVPVCRKAGEG